MVRNRNENQAETGANVEKSPGTQLRENQSRSRGNHQSFNPRSQYQPRQQNGGRSGDTQNRDASSQSISASSTSQGQLQTPQRSSSHGSRTYEGHNAQRGYRDRIRDADKDQKHYAQSYAKHTGTQKSRAEETIDDIKQDIIRIEKEIELEIKEIRSLKFL